MNRICLSIAVLFSSYFASAQSDTTIVMKGLVFNGNRSITPFAEASRNIHIITGEQISRMPAQSLPEILSYTPGVDIRQRGPMGVQSDIGIRGGSFEQTLILLNGIKLTDPQTGHHVMNIPVPFDHIQQIDVLKGPGARIYGQNAFAGAVNFITKVPESKKVGLRTYGGSFGSYGGTLSLSAPLENFKQYVSLSRDASDGYRHNTDYQSNNIFYQANLPLNAGSYEMIFGLTDRKFGANGFYASPDYTEQYEEVRTNTISISYESEMNDFLIKPRVYWRGNRDKYLFIRDNPGAYQNLHHTNTFGAEINSSYQTELGATSLGIEYRLENIRGDWLRGGTESKSNLDGFERENFGVFADHKFNLVKRFDVTPGVYVNWYSDFGWNAFPGIDLGYNVSEAVRLYANFGKSYRVPTFYDQYYSSPIEEGNPDLKPEEALTYELGIRYINNGVSLEANYFVRDASQLIDWVWNPVDSIYHSQNFQNVQTQGVELAMNINFQNLMHKGYWLSAISLSYNYLDQDLNEVENVFSRYALEHVRNQVVFGIEHNIAGKLKNSFKARYIDRFEQDDYMLLDDRIYYEHNEAFSVFLEVVNISDQQYTEVMTPMPGRWIRAGINLDIGL